jgi:uncharacterized membrane protein YhhN
LVAATVFTLLGASFVVLLVAGESRSARMRLIAKPAASLFFIATALAAGGVDSSYGRWVLVALVLSAVGDVALLGSSTPAFLGGLVSFLLGHVAYTIAFAVRGLDVVWMGIAVVVLVAPSAAVLRWLLPHAGALRGPVVAYAVVISAMVVSAAGTVGFDSDTRILAAAAAFYVSDLAVARDRFVAPGPVNRWWGLPLYYGAQFLFAWTVVV